MKYLDIIRDIVEVKNEVDRIRYPLGGSNVQDSENRLLAATYKFENYILHLVAKAIEAGEITALNFLDHATKEVVGDECVVVIEGSPCYEPVHNNDVLELLGSTPIRSKIFAIQTDADLFSDVSTYVLGNFLKWEYDPGTSEEDTYEG